MTTWAVLLAGNLSPTRRLRDQIHGARVVAADGGMRHAAALGVAPELWIGDFDSSPAPLINDWPDVPRQEHPAAKDMTDGALAIAHAVKEGASRIVLAGAFGGRTDHALAHLTQLVELAERHIPALATSGVEEAWPLLPGETRPDLPEGTRFSIIGLTPLAGVSISGARWPLENASLPLGSSRPLSNEAHGPLRISLKEGRGLLLAHFPARPVK